MKTILYIDGDVREPINKENNNLITHIVNNLGVMGAGVALALLKKWPLVMQRYKEWFKEDKDFKLGNIQTVRVEDKIVVVNMIAQNNIFDNKGVPPIRYDALKSCLQKVNLIANKHNATVNLPYLMGAGLAGGDWNKIEQMIKEELSNKDLDVIIYKYEDPFANMFKGEIK